MLGWIEGKYDIKCPRCKEINKGEHVELSFKEAITQMAERNIKGTC
jgi:phage FluMu protein Com